MRVALVTAELEDDMEMMINDKICELLDDDENVRIVDIKCWSDSNDPSSDKALILWELKDG